LIIISPAGTASHNKQPFDCCNLTGSLVYEKEIVHTHTVRYALFGTGSLRKGTGSFFGQ